MKFNIDGTDREIKINGIKQVKIAKKAKLSDKKEKLNDVVKKFIATKKG